MKKKWNSSVGRPELGRRNKQRVRKVECSGWKHVNLNVVFPFFFHLHPYIPSFFLLLSFGKINALYEYKSCINEKKEEIKHHYQKKCILFYAYPTVTLTTTMILFNVASALTCPLRISLIHAHAYIYLPSTPTHKKEVLLRNFHTYLVPWFFSTVFPILLLVHRSVVVLSLRTLIRSAGNGCFHMFAGGGKMQWVSLKLQSAPRPIELWFQDNNSWK